MEKRTIFYLSLSVLLGTNLSAQYKLDVDGFVRIRGGNLEISYNPDSTSVHIGRRAGYQAQAQELRENTYFGVQAGEKNQFGRFNTAVGHGAGRDNTGSRNSFLGRASGVFNTTGEDNTFVGFQTGMGNNGNKNIFIGSNAGRGNEDGYENLYIGYFAGFGNNMSSGHNNIALGRESSYQTVSGNNNISIGSRSLYINDHGFQNIAIGNEALYYNYNNYNVAVGTQSLYNTNTGTQNTALGGFAGFDNNNASSTFLGYGAGSTVGVTNGTAVGYDAKVNDNNKVRIGNASVTVIEGNVAFSPMSDRRLKENIQPVPLGLDFILDLNPVVYHRISNEKEDLEMGLIAQELDSVLIQHHAEEMSMINRGGDGYLSVRYNDLLAPLIQAIQEQQEIIEELKMENKSLSENVDFLMNVVTTEENPKIKHSLKGKKNKTFAVK